MIKKPLIIKIIAFVYFVLPIALVLQLMWVHSIEFTKLYFALDWYTVLMIVLPLVVGFGIWQVRRWGYCLLIIHSALLIFNNIVFFIIKMSVFSTSVVLFFNILAVTAIITFTRREIYTPYFHPRVRWWEQAARYYSDMKILVRDLAGVELLFEAGTFDISETGVFISTEREVRVGDLFNLEIHLASNSIIYADGEAVWINKEKRGNIPPGFGCKFTGTDSTFRKRIRFHLRDIGAKMRER